MDITKLFYNKKKLKEAAERFVSQGLTEKALECYQRIYAREPDEINTLCMMGDLKIMLGDLQTGGSFIQKAARLYVQQNEIPKAISILRKYLRSRADDWEAQATLGDLLIQSGNTAEGLDAYRKAASSSASVDTAKSIFFLEKTAKLDPGNVDTLVSLAEAYLSQKIYAKGGEYHLRAGKKFFENGNFVRAYLHLQEASHFLSENAEISLIMLRALMRLKSYDDALAHLNQFSDPNKETNKEILGHWIEVLFGLNQFDALVNLMHHVRSHLADGDELPLRLAERAMTEGNTPLAMRLIESVDVSQFFAYSTQVGALFNRILSQDPENATVMRRLLDLKVEIGDQDGIRVLLPRLYQLYQKQSNIVQAYQLLEKWLTIDDENDWVRKEMRRVKLQMAERSPRRPDLIRGKVEDISIPDLVQMLESARKSGVLHVRYADLSGRIFFSEGNVVHASFMEISGPSSFVPLFKLPGGDFMFESGLPENCPRTIHGSNTQVVLDALRIIDEQSHLAASNEHPG